jgi:hypothetical protein
MFERTVWKVVGRLILASLLAVLCFGCGAAELSPAGAKVVTSLNGPSSEGYPSESCKLLGPVTGEGGGAGGALISNDELMRYALNDLRNNAASMGANFVQYSSPQLGVSGDKNGTNTTSATVMGNAYDCTESSPSSSSADTPSPELRGLSFRKAPEGAAGFRFGFTPEQAQLVCEKAGNAYLGTPTKGSCSGAASNLGAPATVELTFCGQAICQIRVTLLPDEANYVDFYKSLGSSLKQLYGAPFSKTSKTTRCATPEQLPTCVVAKTAIITFEWRWQSRYQVSLSTTTDGKQASVLLSYSNPKITAVLAPGPTL